MIISVLGAVMRMRSEGEVFEIGFEGGGVGVGWWGGGFMDHSWFWSTTELMCFWVSRTRFTSGRSGMAVPWPTDSLYCIYPCQDVHSKTQ